VKKICLLSTILCLLWPSFLLAAMMTFDETYVYDAGEADSKLTCRAISLLQAKRILLEKLGTHIESRTQITNFQVTKDEITSISAGIVKTKIVKEDWDGSTYTLVARMTADPDNVLAAIKRTINDQADRKKVKKLKNINIESIQKIEALKDELTRAQKDLIGITSDFRKSAKLVDAWGAYEAGMNLMQENRPKEAVAAFDKAIAARPTYLNLYQRGRAYHHQDKYRKALSDYDAAIQFNPKLKNAYYHRGRALRKIGQKQQGLMDIEKAAKMGNGQAKQWLKLKGF
jgi:tetratricopeptide (TPR) repeat protein